MLDILLLIGIFWCGIIAGQHIMAWKLRYILLDAARRDGFKVTDDFQMEDPNTIKVAKLYVEKSNDTLYLYNYDNEEFVCQANTIEELANLALQYKNIKHAAVIDGENAFVFIDGTVKHSV